MPAVVREGLHRHSRVAAFRGCPKEETESEMGPAADAGRPALGAIAHNMTSPITWRRSSWCSTNSCVEVADLPDGKVAVRDSKSPAEAQFLTFTSDEWTAFISGVKAGEFG